MTFYCLFKEVKETIERYKTEYERSLAELEHQHRNDRFSAVSIETCRECENLKAMNKHLNQELALQEEASMNSEYEERIRELENNLESQEMYFQEKEEALFIQIEEEKEQFQLHQEQQIQQLIYQYEEKMRSISEELLKINENESEKDIIVSNKF